MCEKVVVRTLFSHSYIHIHGYADPYDPFGLFSRMPPCHGNGSLRPAFYQHTRFSTLLSITCSSLDKLSSVRHHPALLLLCLLLFRFTALMWSNYCWLRAPLFTVPPCFVQETVWIYVFHCSTLRPSPWASHLNEIDVSDTTTHTCTRTHRSPQINGPLFAFIWLLLAYRLLKGSLQLTETK